MSTTSRRARLGSLARSDRGAAVPSALVLVIVLAAVGVSAVLLVQTLTTAQNINNKAEQIADAGAEINNATSSVSKLRRTNELAESILATAQPLEGQLATIVGHAQSIDGLASSINSSAGDINATAGAINQNAGDIISVAGQINSTAGDIDSTAGGINSEAAGILDVAQRIESDVNQINQNLDGTIGIAQQIKGDTGNIVVQAREAHQNAACIDNKLLGSNDGHC